MRRTALLFVLLVAALGVAAVGCGGEQEQSATPETVEGPLETTTETTETETDTETTGTETTGTETTETETTETETTPALEGDPVAGKAVFTGASACYWLPHARRRGRDGPGRPEPRRRDALRRARHRPRHERPGRHAVLLELADRAADRRRRSVRLVGRRQVDLSKIPPVIDLKAARADTDRWRAALARKGAAEDFDALLEADERWRALIPRVDELRGQTKLKGKPSPEELEALRPVKAALKEAEDELARAEAARDAALALVPNPPDDVGARRRLGGRRRGAATGWRPARARRSARAHGDRTLRHGACRACLGSTLRVRHGRRRARGDGALPVRPRPSRERRLHARHPPGPRPRGSDVRQRFLPDRAIEHLRARGGRALPHRDFRGRARGTPHGRDPPGAPAALHGLLDLLPPRGRRGRQGHAWDVPRPPVQQGRDVRVRRARRPRGTSTSECSTWRSSSSRRSAFRTAW